MAGSYRPQRMRQNTLSGSHSQRAHKQGFPVFFITAADLQDHLRSAFQPESEITYDMLFEQVRNAPC
jgi:hypothetical protein